jgi:glutamyl-tRNA synthetase/nondiscriminating glutamyl-tRNA synthetase
MNNAPYEVRVRFAPSPTGELHVGGARTALFNWLFARNQSGTFILRIEDTDVKRSSENMVKGILEGLKWLGLQWDEGPYFQSDRLKFYQITAQKLFKEGLAYYCYCSPDELAEERRKAQKNRQLWKYDRRCLKLTPSERKEKEKKGMQKALRFLVPPGKTIFHDIVRGKIEVDNQTIEDFVLLRSDNLPTYHLSCVVDDIEMGINYVIRGEDHISNTPKQILLYHALAKEPPNFAHLPLILGSDRSRLSKRHGATSLLHYREQGFLPDAMVNFLALLGWSPGDDRTLVGREELIQLFSLEQVSKTSAVFDLQKLEWLNSQYINNTKTEELIPRIKKELEKANLWQDDLLGSKKKWFYQLIELLKPRAKRLGDFARDSLPFLSDSFEYDEKAIKKHLNVPSLRIFIKELHDNFAQMESFEEVELERVLRETAYRLDIKAAVLIHATRVALTGQAVSPGIFEVLALLGKEKTLARLQMLLDFLGTS